MKVRVTIALSSETNDQDKFLKLALEKLAWNVGNNNDRKLVLDTFKARAVLNNLEVELL